MREFVPMVVVDGTRRRIAKRRRRVLRLPTWNRVRLRAVDWVRGRRRCLLVV